MPLSWRSWPSTGGAGRCWLNAAQEPADDFAAFMDRMPKYVVTVTLTEARCTDSTVVTSDFAAQIQALKDRTRAMLGPWSSGCH